MQLTSPQTPGGQPQFYMIAVKRDINANSLGINVLDWQGTFNASNTISVVARIYRKTGTLSLMVGAIRLNSVIVQPVLAVASALLGSGSDPLQYMMDSSAAVAVFSTGGNFDFNVTSLNLSASTIDVEIWGMKSS